MESVNEIKEALSARSRTATLDELRNEGRKRVRLIRAEHVASMISEAVHAAVEQSGLVAPEEVKKLVDKSRQEFRTILREREQELERAQENERTLAERDQEIAELKAQLAAAGASPATAGRSAPGGAAAGAMSNELVMSLVQEMATLKANMMTQQGQGKGGAAAAAATGGGGGTDMTAAIDRLAGSLNERLEKLGTKMGSSAAVDDSAPVDFGGLFKDLDSKTIESNMDNVEVKQKSGGGIAANLARLKKLKGGG